MAHKKGHGRSGALTKSFDASVKKHKKAVASGKAKLSRSPADITKEVKAKVSTELGLTTVPNTPPPGQEWSGMDSSTSTIAMNLTGNDKWMYGEEASAATDKHLKDYEGMGVYTTSGNLIGGNVVSKAAVDIKYGESGGAMGSGDPTGVMTSIPISNKMLQSQNKIKTIVQGAIGLMTPAPISTIAKLGMAKSSADVLQPGAAYEDYTKKFAAAQAGKKFTSTRNLFGLLGLTGHKKKTLGE